MKIKFSKRFEKRFKRLESRKQKKILNIIDIFSENPHTKSLHNHSLNGRLEGKNAITVSGDIRIIFEEFDNYVLVIMLDVGSHNQVYN